MFCINCGTEFNESQAFCPHCKESVTQKISGTRRPTIINVNNSSNGSIGTGVFVGSIVLFFIGWVPIIGGLIGGGIAGLIAKGKGRGLIAGFITGIIGSVLLAIVLTFLGALVGSLFNSLALGGLIAGGIGTILIILSIGQTILCAIGGLIGGSLRN